MSEVEQVMAIVERVKPLLAGKASSIQGAVLAELLSLWLAGHHPPGGRDAILKVHIVMVRKLMAVNAQILSGEPQ